ncbi:unnamed protein product [Prunus brigantina]
MGHVRAQFKEAWVLCPWRREGRGAADRAGSSLQVWLWSCPDGTGFGCRRYGWLR